MKVMVLGATGLLGRAVVAAAVRRHYAVRSVARADAEITIDIAAGGALHSVLTSELPDIIINCAGLVDVAACERDPGVAYRVNSAPLAVLAQWTRNHGAKLVHISTDHFFAGYGPVAHDEKTEITLVNAYAATKLAGEHFALLDPYALVLRTSIVGMHSRNQASFAEWAISAILSDRPMTLFADAFTSSIDVGAFADAAFDLTAAGASGVLNLASSEVYSKEAFVRRLAITLGRSLTGATSGSVAALSPPRLASLGLDVRRALEILGRPLPDLDAVVRALVTTYRSE